jgi:hypothetical protein
LDEAKAKAMALAGKSISREFPFSCLESDMISYVLI